MQRTLGGVEAVRLERSCSRRPDSISFGPSAQGVERAEVYLSSYAFEPHRHDTYGIGLTTTGVQTVISSGVNFVDPVGIAMELLKSKKHRASP